MPSWSKTHANIELLSRGEACHKARLSWKLGKTIEVSRQNNNFSHRKIITFYNRIFFDFNCDNNNNKRCRAEVELCPWIWMRWWQMIHFANYLRHAKRVILLKWKNWLIRRLWTREIQPDVNQLHSILLLVCIFNVVVADDAIIISIEWINSTTTSIPH